MDRGASLSSALDLSLWRQAETLFEAVLDRPAEERDHFLDRACGDDRDLRQCVENLLLRDQEDPHFLEIPLAKPLHLIREPKSESHWVGRQLGAFRLQQLIGSGGMSQVFLAERMDEDVEEKVAVKVIGERPGHASLLRALRRERQILAKLDHPNIARALDGGTTDEGWPYVVLEYVDGLPITEFCDVARLNVRQRLQLFGKVCSAVDYAHRHLVIHRDLKPSNILVTDEGEPKLLDFGIAKLLDVTSRLGVEDRTQTHERFFTLQYASPEQLAGEPVSTASDTFSLGVLLYQMLAGQRPREVAEALAESAGEPLPWFPFPPPSAVATSGGSAESRRALEPPERRAEVRDTTPVQLQRQLVGDLDSIVLHCLRRRPNERYGSVSDLGEDIQRYLIGLPVSARPPKWTYRVGKFILRHRLGVALGSAAILALTLLGIGLVVQSRQVIQERDRAEVARAEAEEVTQFLVETFALSDPYQSSQSGLQPGEEVTVQEVLDHSAKRIRDQLVDEPRLQSRLMHTIGTVIDTLGRHEEAASLHQEALAIRRHAGGRPLEVVESLNGLGLSYAKMGQLNEAIHLFEEALSMARRVPVGNERQLAESLTNMAMSSLMQGRDLAQAEASMRHALQLRSSIFEPDHREVVQSQLYLGSLLRQKGDLDGAEEILNQALESCRRAEGDDHAQVASILGTLARVLTQRGDFATAEAYHTEILEILAGRLGETHPNSLQARGHLGLFYREVGKYEAAEETIRVTLALQRRAHPDDIDSQTAHLNNLGLIHLDQVRPAEAEPFFREALEIATASEGESRGSRPFYLRNLGLALHGQGNAEEAEPLFREAALVLEKEQGSKSIIFAYALTSHASALTSLGSFDEALALSTQAEEILLQVFPPEHPRVAMARGAQGGALIGLQRFQEAEPLLIESLQHLEASAAHQKRALGVARQRLVQLYETLGRPDEAQRYRTAESP